MKAISTIIATILLVVITIGLVSSAYLFVGGILTGSISKIISLVNAKAHRVVVRNDGTDTIASDEISVSVNSQEVVPINPQDIEPQDTVTLRFVPPELDMRSAKVVVLGPSNTLSYTTDIVPHESRVTSDTIGLWYFNSVNASDYTLDESSYHNDGLLTNMDPATDLVEGRFSQALEFDGSNDYVNVADSPSLDISGNQISIESWFKTSKVHDGAIVWKSYSTYNPTYGFSYFGSVYGSIIGRITNSTGDTKSVGFGWVADGQWHHLVMTYNGSVINLYMDGKLKTSTTLNGNILPFTSNVIMGDRETDHMYFNGTIDEVHILNRALTQEEILDGIYG